MRQNIFIILCLVCSLSSFAIVSRTSMDAYSLWQLNESAKLWPTTDAKIIELYNQKRERYVSYGMHETITEICCYYEYQVNGKVYTSNHITFNRSSSRALAKAKVGDMITVRYNHKDPLQVIVSTEGFSIMRKLLGAAGVLFLGLVPLVIGIRLYRIGPIDDHCRYKVGVNRLN